MTKLGFHDKHGNAVAETNETFESNFISQVSSVFNRWQRELISVLVKLYFKSFYFNTSAS